jgi:hypothetical protein
VCFAPRTTCDVKMTCSFQNKYLPQRPFLFLAPCQRGQKSMSLTSLEMECFVQFHDRFRFRTGNSDSKSGQRWTPRARVMHHPTCGASATRLPPVLLATLPAKFMLTKFPGPVCGGPAVTPLTAKFWVVLQEARNAPFCPSQEKFHTVVNPPMTFLL